MLKFHIYLICFGLVACCKIHDALAGYSKIDEYLRQTVDNEDIEANLGAAEQWLAQNSDLKSKLFKKSPVEDFRTFVALRQVLGKDKCNEESYMIMSENELNIGDLFMRIHSDRVKRRVDSIVYQILEQHARDCQDVYPLLLKEKLGHIDDFKKLTRAGLFAEAILMETLGRSSASSSKQLYDSFIGNILEIKDLRRSRIIKQKLTEFSEGDPDQQYLVAVEDERKPGKKVVRKDKIRELVDRYLVEPCRYFVNQLGPDIFIPARWDATTLPPKLGDIQFFYYWTDFRICEVVSKNGQTLASDLVRILEKESNI